MTVTVLVFSSWADAIGSSRVELELDSNATAGDAIAAIRQRVPNGACLPAPMIAVNREYAELDQRVVAGDELAIIPPVAGG